METFELMGDRREEKQSH